LQLNEYAKLSEWINDPATQVLWEFERSELLFVKRLGEGSIKVVVRYQGKRVDLDLLINALKVKTKTIESGINGGLYEVWR
jgi:hypothetical protein